jgi:hypothetical protein
MLQEGRLVREATINLRFRVVDEALFKTVCEKLNEIVCGTETEDLAELIERVVLNLDLCARDFENMDDCVGWLDVGLERIRI